MEIAKSASQHCYNTLLTFLFSLSILVVGIYAEPNETNPRHFHVKIAGPSDTPYEGGMFFLELFLPE